jgi:hypothetical protein
MHNLRISISKPGMIKMPATKLMIVESMSIVTSGDLVGEQPDDGRWTPTGKGSHIQSVLDTLPPFGFN